MLFLKQSTSVDVGIGPFLDSADGVTPETSLTITQPDIRLKKNAGAWAQKNASQTLTHEENGWYEVTLDTTDTNTLGILMVAVNEAGALPVWIECMIMPANVWDSLFGADVLQVDVTQWLGSAPNALSSGRVDTTVGAMASGVVTATAIAADAIGASELAADAVAEIADAVWDEPRSGHTTSGTFGQSQMVVHAGDAQSGSSSTIVLEVTASGTNDFYNEMTIIIVAGAGKNQVRTIFDYTGASNTVAIYGTWDVNPDTTSRYIIIA